MRVTEKIDRPMTENDFDSFNFKSDSDCSEQEFMNKYDFMVQDKRLTVEYLKIKYKWMKGEATWRDVCVEYFKTNAYLTSVKNIKDV
ncbi:MAG TPA: hypothetical protein PLJ18_11830 [Niabella sp.]|nr:hypothetical protein [Bacteroidia bacterium]HRB52067.1 hypothetical protein [Bacteroidia bacterium]HRC03135.1 hypothetical protein [Niabella sp.]